MFIYLTKILPNGEYPMKKYHVRRKDKEITSETVMKKILKATQYVTLAMSKDNQPYLVSLSHGYDEAHHCIYFHCANEGKKLDYLRSNNVIWGQALLDQGYSEGECDHLYASVHFSGKVTFLNTLDEKRRALECMIEHIDKDPDPLIEELNPEGINGTVIGRIAIEYMSGKKSKEAKL